jgi:hypothetical protein
MEVHHHSHIPTKREKKWKHYFWEFFMLFLAVTLGFFVENQREHYVEHRREKQFIMSIVKEIEADIYYVSWLLNDTTRKPALDTLVGLIYSGKINTIDIRKTYYLKKVYAGSIVPMNSLTKNTLTQLKSGGNMRLIRNRNVVDSLNQLDNFIATTEEYLENYSRFSYSNAEFATRIFNDGYFRENGKHMGTAYILNSPSEPRFMTDDYRLLIEYANRISNQAGVLNNYNNWLKHYQQYCTRLIPYIKKEYHLD